MRYLRTNTATRISIGPFFDKTDGVTPETALTVTACKLTMVVDDGGVPTLVLDTNPTASGGANDMVHITGDDAGMYDLELAAANVNYLGRAKVIITDAATHCPVWEDLTILPAMIYDAMILGTDRLDTNVTHITDQSQTARDLGANLTGDVYARLGAPVGASISADITAVDDFLDTEITDIRNRLPAALVSGRMDASVGAYPGNTAQTGDNFTRLGAPAGASIAADVATRASQTSLDVVDDFLDTEIAAIKAKTDNLPASPANEATLVTVAGYLDTEVGAIKAKTDNLPASPAAVSDIPTAAVVADAVWDEDATAHQIQGSFGQAIGDPGADADTLFGLVNTNLDATVSSRSSHTAADVWAVGTRTLSSFGTLVADIATAVWGAATRTLSAFSFSVTVGTNDDKTGYALTSGERTAIANEVETQIIDEADAEKVLTAITDKIAAVNPDLGGLTVAAIASAVWSAATRILTGGTNIVLAKGVGVTGFNDLSPAQVNAEADTALADYDGPTNTELATALATADDAVLVAIGALNNLSQANVRTALGLAAADLDTQLNVLTTIQTLISELHKIQGLDITSPMTVTPSSRVAGAVNLGITGDGINTSTVTRQ